jgi:hypothetical protein
MADIQAVNSVAGASIQAVNSVGLADIQAVNGLGIPASGATRWVVASENGYIAHAANSDRTSWTAYDGVLGTADNDDIGFGKNNGGAGVYIATRQGATRELTISGTNVTTDAEWTDINLDGADTDRIMQILWGARSDGTAAGTWMAVGDQDGQNVYRSVDGGANWSAIDLSGLTGHATADYINGVASDGSGNWMFAQDNRLYYSTDDGASFAVSTPFASGGTPGRPQGIVYTNSSWVLCYSRSSAIQFRSCAASDITDWGTEVAGSAMTHFTTNGLTVKMAAAAGRVAAISEDDDDLNYFDVSGKVISNLTKVDLSMGADKAQDIATDGSTWLIAATDGDIWESTDAAESWSQIVDGFQADGSSELDLESITCDVLLPI